MGFVFSFGSVSVSSGALANNSAVAGDSQSDKAGDAQGGAVHIYRSADPVPLPASVVGVCVCLACMVALRVCASLSVRWRMCKLWCVRECECVRPWAHRQACVVVRESVHGGALGCACVHVSVRSRRMLTIPFDVDGQRCS